MPVRGKIFVDESYCKACELCINACPVEALELAQDRLNPTGYHPAQLANNSCTGCAVCALVCPEAAITVYRAGSPVREKIPV